MCARWGWRAIASLVLLNDLLAISYPRTANSSQKPTTQCAKDENSMRGRMATTKLTNNIL